MLKTMLAATTALALMSGVSFAQSSYSSSTTDTTTSMPAPTSNVDVSTTTRHSVDADGMTTEKDKTVTTGASMSPLGDVTTSKKKTETTTIR
jgi:hypothetical protein